MPSCSLKCMYTCSHTYMFAYIQTYTHTYLHTYVHTFMHTYMHTYVHTCTHTYTHICKKKHTSPMPTFIPNTRSLLHAPTGSRWRCVRERDPPQEDAAPLRRSLRARGRGGGAAHARRRRAREDRFRVRRPTGTVGCTRTDARVCSRTHVSMHVWNTYAYINMAPARL